MDELDDALGLNALARLPWIHLENSDHAMTWYHRGRIDALHHSATHVDALPDYPDNYLVVAYQDIPDQKKRDLPNDVIGALSQTEVKLRKAKGETFVLEHAHGHRHRIAGYVPAVKAFLRTIDSGGCP